MEPGTDLSQLALHSPHREPALLASMPARLRPPRGRGQEFSGLQAEKEFLAGLLVEHSLGGGLQDLTLLQNSLGKPLLLVDDAPGPPISFSWSAGRLFAALGAPGSGIGLDAASPEEFAGAYPFERVFNPEEWQAATLLTGGDREEAAALLWSVKEAVVKAQGCGYRFFGPRQVRVEPAGLGEQGPLWRGRLEAPFLDHFPQGSQGILPAASVRVNKVWLSVAWMQAPADNSALARVG